MAGARGDGGNNGARHEHHHHHLTQAQSDFTTATTPASTTPVDRGRGPVAAELAKGKTVVEVEHIDGESSPPRRMAGFPGDHPEG